jgi:predicted methyltransferase MtxX (methanogen marker protein 4)
LYNESITENIREILINKTKRVYMALSPDPEKREAQLNNLKMGANGLQGRPKGSRNWSSVVQALLDDEKLFATLLENMERKPAWLEPTGTKTLMQAITTAQAIKAMGGSHFSAEWLRKTGWGDKVDITSGGERIRMEPVVVTHLKPRNIIEGQVVEPIEETTDDAPSPQA